MWRSCLAVITRVRPVAAVTMIAVIAVIAMITMIAMIAMITLVLGFSGIPVDRMNSVHPSNVTREVSTCIARAIMHTQALD